MKISTILTIPIILSLVNFIHCYERCDCGRTGIQRRVFGGNETYHNQYPWMAHLSLQLAWLLNAFCHDASPSSSSSLISCSSSASIPKLTSSASISSFSSFTTRNSLKKSHGVKLKNLILSEELKPKQSTYKHINNFTDNLTSLRSTNLTISNGVGSEKIQITGDSPTKTTSCTSNVTRLVWTLFYDHVGSTQYGLCGGSLIDHQHIITAAHCVHDASGNPRNVDAVHVYLGAHNLYHLPKVRRVEKFILPKNYNFARPVHNDFAILKLVKPVKFNDKISPICIPKSDDEPYRKLRVAGWGHLGPNQKTAKTLQHVDVYHVRNSKCYEMVKDYIYSNYAIVRRNPEKYKIPPIHENHMCAVDGNTGGDACQGDSGGPLMYLNPNNNRFYLIALVSGAYDQCGDKHTPGFYTLVRNFRYMIRDLAPHSHICHY
ncbi:snake venom serine protease serpentokallikrein-2-like [Tetranychus urticae]|uniref:snake venom serine protease serpentokallikrein-2-like n=1 Tax=Tetranychus urticae TaxID=32264 RepID=UPI000D65E289|nr:snake venom serine protease serpentokallikrein-2-like [Tetranychus urticae]